MAKYSDKKATKSRNTISDALNIFARRELALQGIDSKIKVSELKADEDGDIYMHIDFDYCGVHDRHENYYIWRINDEEIGGWIDPIYIMGIIMADIIEDLRVLNEMK